MILLCVVTVVWWTKPWQATEPTSNVDQASTTTVDPDQAEDLAPLPTVEPEPNPAVETRTVVFRPLQGRTDDDRALPPALVLGTTGAKPVLLLPIAVFPLNGDLKDADGSALHVVTWSLQGGFVLLTSSTLATIEVAEPAVAQTGARYAVADEDGRSVGEVTVIGRAEDGMALRLDQAAPSVCALYSDDGKVVGYTLGENQAIAFDLVLPWMGRPGTSTIAGTAAEIRRTSPGHLQAEARTLIKEGKTPTRIREALVLLEQALALARDRGSIETLTEDLIQTHRLLLETLAGSDPSGALAQVRQSLSRFPGDAQLLLDGILLAIRAEDAASALWFHGQLSALSPDHARSASERIGDGLGALAQRHVMARRYQDALDILRPVVQICPLRADLRALYARALHAAGQQGLAAAEAAEAARLDPSHQPLANRFTVDRTPQEGKVEIPFDPETRLILTEVSFAGQGVRLVVDSGASLTTIPTAVADRLNLRKAENRRVRVTTASGVIEGEVVTVPWVQIGGLRIAEVEAVVLDLPGSLAGRGLLGLNVLSRLHMEMDNVNSRLILRQGRGRRGR